ncbi:hypothetical protein Taro_004396 [Colocasia esculenta]|uniref:Uncharacterized protein n=1 Tax=Colocasia esculenta TaxID=4460 RepID=A0A843TUS7_COLES|nr:hypothetical protein [Colocasia esculenta]
MLKYSSPNSRDEFYNLLGSCGGVLGGWEAGTTTRRSSSSPFRLLRPMQPVPLGVEQRVIEDSSSVRLLSLGRLRSRKKRIHSLHLLLQKATFI